MTRLSACFSAVTILCGMAFGQSAEKPEFLVADVHSSPRTAQPIVRGPFYTPGRYELRFATMLDMIRIAYGVDPERVSGGPTWLEMDRFDVLAKTPEKSNAETRKLMLQSLLADRFKLSVHNDSRPMPAYGLTAKNAHLKESGGDGETGCKFSVENTPKEPPAGGGGPIQLPTLVYTCRNTTMSSFAQLLPNAPAASQYLNNRLVVDQTELKASYDFTLRYTPKVPAGLPATGEQIPLFDALEKQLGIRLEPTTARMPTIVVDNVNQKPTENSAEAMKSFPPQPTEFEVASLKPSPSDARPGQPDIKNGRLYVPGISLQNLIMVAWEINGPDFLVNAPKWLSDDKYDILAKAPEGVAIGDLTPMRNTVPVNIDALRPMLRALIVERFRLAVHNEERPMNAYTLVANKPRLKKGDPTARTRWQEGTAPESSGDKNANAALGRLVTCQNMTMAQFAELLPSIAPGYLRTNVVDATGLEGGYDFTFSFSPIGALTAAQTARPPADRGAAPEGTAEAPDPSGAISLFDALNKQLGLKLETVKRPAQVLVIDKVERKALEN
jgi:uncharacterized protein (TIGR03435 family)